MARWIEVKRMTDEQAKAGWVVAMEHVKAGRFEEALKVDLPWADKNFLRQEIAKAKKLKPR